jgi:hypothetical protein
MLEAGGIRHLLLRVRVLYYRSATYARLLRRTLYVKRTLVCTDRSGRVVEPRVSIGQRHLRFHVVGIESCRLGGRCNRLSGAIQRQQRLAIKRLCTIQFAALMVRQRRLRNLHEVRRCHAPASLKAGDAGVAPAGNYARLV